MNTRIKTSIFAFITVLLWGSGFPFTRAIGNEIGSYELGFIRCFLAALILFAIGKACHIKRPEKKDLGWFALSGVFGFSLYFILFNMGLETLSSATGSMISAISPILTALIALKLYGDRISITGWITLFTAFLGVAILLMWGNGLDISIGALYMFLSAALFAGYSILTRFLGDRGYSSLEIATYSAILGCLEMIFFLPGAVSDVLSASLQADACAFYLGAMPSAAAYYLWAKAIATAEKTTDATNFLFINPLIASIIGVILVHEIPGPEVYIGGIIIIASVVIFSFKGNKS